MYVLRSRGLNAYGIKAVPVCALFCAIVCLNMICFGSKLGDWLFTPDSASCTGTSLQAGMMIRVTHKKGLFNFE